MHCTFLIKQNFCSDESFIKYCIYHHGNGRQIAE
jgi:hypothetical protein